MLTKVLAVVLAVAVPGVGGVVYMKCGGSCPFSSSEACPLSAAPAHTECALPADPTCCESPSRTSCFTEALGCCNDHEPTVAPEVLTIAPRELK